MSSQQRQQQQIQQQQQLEQMRQKLAAEAAAGSGKGMSETLQIRILLNELLNRIEVIENSLGIERSYQVTDPLPVGAGGAPAPSPDPTKKKPVTAPSESTQPEQKSCPHCHQPIATKILLLKAPGDKGIETHELVTQ